MTIRNKAAEGARILLRETFDHHLKLNPRYSLRAFAKSVGIHPSTLSQIISGKRNITEKCFQDLAEYFELPTLVFIDKCLDSHKEAHTTHDELPLDVFNSIADWYHDAILELIHTDDFQPDYHWIAQAIGVNYNQVKIAVERLMRLGLLEIQDDGAWVDINKDNLASFDSQFTNSALKKHQKQMLDVSKNSIEQNKRGQRDHTSFMFCIDENLLPELHKKIREFELELVEYIENNSKAKDHVHAIQFSSFPVSNQKAKRGEK